MFKIKTYEILFIKSHGQQFWVNFLKKIFKCPCSTTEDTSVVLTFSFETIDWLTTFLTSTRPIKQFTTKKSHASLQSYIVKITNHELTNQTFFAFCSPVCYALPSWRMMGTMCNTRILLYDNKVKPACTAEPVSQPKKP